MKWSVQLCIFLTLIHLSAYADRSYEPAKVSPKGQLFADRVVHIYCFFYGGIYSESYCQKTQKNQQIIDELRTGISPPFYGHINLRQPTQWPRDRSLKDYADWAKTIPADDLIELTKHPHVYVRTSAFQALVNAYPEVDFVPIIIEHIDDNEELGRSLYDERGNVKAGDDFFDIAAGSSFFRLQVDRFTPAQRKRLWKALLKTPNQLDAMSDFVLQAQATTKLYKQLKVIKDKNAAVIYRLAQYQRPEDAEMLLNYFIAGDADKSNILTKKYIRLFTAAKLSKILFSEKDKERFKRFKSLDKYRTHTLTYDYRRRMLVRLYDAIASRLKSGGLYALNKFLFQTDKLSNQQRTLHRGLLFGAISQNHGGKHDDLLWYFWQEENRVILTNYDYLIQKDPEKALEIIKTNLKNLEEFYQANKSGDVYRLVIAMLDFVVEQDRDNAIKIIKYNLEKPAQPVSVLFGIFTRKIKAMQDKQFVETLLKILESDQQYIVHHVVLVLISFKDNSLNQKVASSLQKNRSSRTSSNWQWLYERFEAGGVLDGQPNNKVRLDVIFRS